MFSQHEHFHQTGIYACGNYVEDSFCVLCFYEAFVILLNNIWEIALCFGYVI